MTKILLLICNDYSFIHNDNIKIDEIFFLKFEMYLIHEGIHYC